MDYCTVDCIEIYGHLNINQMCTFTQKYCIQDTVQFIQAYFCIIKESFIIMIVLSAILLYLLFTLINFINDNYLTKTVEQFIDEFKISPTLAGVTFLAFANGAPDVLTAIIAGSSDSASTALIPFGSIFGACLFSTAFILSCVIFCQPNSNLSIEKRKILIPLGFYLSGIMILLITSAAYGKMNIWISLSLVGLYLIFIVIQLINQRKQRRNRKRREESGLNNTLILSNTTSLPLTQTINTDELQKSIQEEQPIKQEIEEESSSFFGKLNDSLDNFYQKIFCYFIPPFSLEQWKESHKVIISLILSPFGLAFTQNMPDVFYKNVFTDSEGNGGVPLFLLLSIPAILLLIYTLFKIVIKKETPSNMKVFSVYSFLVIIGWISIFCSILINLIELIQLLTKINSVFLGMTVLAWANCLGDYLSVTKFAKLGNAQTAVAGIFSGQLFNFLIGFGITLTVQSIANGTYQFNIFKFEGDSTYVLISDSIILLVIGCGFIYLIYTFYRVLTQLGTLRKRDGNISRISYFIFLFLALLLSVIADFFYEISCEISIFARASRIFS